MNPVKTTSTGEENFQDISKEITDTRIHLKKRKIS